MGEPSPGRCSSRCGKGQPKRNWPGRSIRRGASHSAFSHHQRVRRLGYRTAHLHILECRPPGAAAGPLFGGTERGFDAAMSVHLDRFLNVPPARVPEPNGSGVVPEELLAELPVLLDERQRVDEAGKQVAGYLYSGGEADRLLAVLGSLLLREDRNFHTIQAVEAAFMQYGYLRGTTVGAHVLVAAARYLAAHSPTMRSQGQTYDIARRLSRGEILYEE